LGGGQQLQVHLGEAPGRPRDHGCLSWHYWHLGDLGPHWSEAETIGLQIVRVVEIISDGEFRSTFKVTPDGNSLLIGSMVVGVRLLADRPQSDLDCEAAFAEVDVRPIVGEDFSTGMSASSTRTSEPR
jgi:hypothetical protein